MTNYIDACVREEDGGRTRGLLSRHDDGEPDYLLRLRESFRAGKPLIKELEPYVDPGSATTLRGLSGEHLHHAGHGKDHGLTQIEDQFREMKSTPSPPFGISAGRVRRLHDAYVI